MPIPATSGQFRTKRSDMEIGDYIACKYTAASGVAGVFSDFGAPLATAQANEIPITGTATPSGYFYFIKSEKGLLIPDRVIQTNISWDVLNVARMIQGFTPPESTILRSPTNMTGYTAPSPYAVTYSNVFTENYAWYPFSALTASTCRWYALQAMPTDGHWLKIFLGSATSVSSMYLESFDCGASSIKDWNLYGSNDDIKYDLITNATFPNSIGGITYPFNEVSYAYYRINLLGSYVGTDRAGIGKIRLYNQSPPPLGDARVRSLTGGNAYLGTDGKASLADQGLGAWPVNNEWDRHIVNSNLGGKITAGDDNVWHWSNCMSWCQDTTINGMTREEGTISASNYRSARSYKLLNGGTLDLLKPWFNLSGLVHGLYGFRPVLEYPEDSKCTNIWY